MKKYNVPATEVVAIVSGFVMQTTSPGGGGDTDYHANPQGATIPD